MANKTVAKPKRKVRWSFRFAFFFTHWRNQLLLTTGGAFLAGWLIPKASSSADLLRLNDFQTHAIVLGFIASILAFTATLMVTHVLQYLDSALTEKADSYFRFREILFKMDEFLRKQTATQLVHEARSLSWELKKLRLEDLPLKDWGKRVESLTKEYQASLKQDKTTNLPLEIMGYITYCEEMLSTIGVSYVKQVVSTIFLEAAIKMFVFLGLVILTLLYFCFFFSDSTPGFRIGSLTFFSTGCLLLCYEFAARLYRHVAEGAGVWGDDK
jgi:hypothetical protein